MRIRPEIKLTLGQQKTLAGTLFVMGLLAIYGWAVRPHVGSLRAAQQYEWATTERVDLGEIINDDLRAEQAKLQTLRAERTAFSEMAFSPAEAVKFHNDLQALCRETGCGVARLSYGNDESIANDGGEETVSAIVIRSASLTVHGAYGGVVRLLDVLMSRPQKVWIDSFEVTTLPSKPDRVVCDMMITICVDHEKGSTHYD